LCVPVWGNSILNFFGTTWASSLGSFY
jgi:hypothetical protein